MYAGPAQKRRTLLEKDLNARSRGNACLFFFKGKGSKLTNGEFRLFSGKWDKSMAYRKWR
jgi:hypothetical protein